MTAGSLKLLNRPFTLQSVSMLWAIHATGYRGACVAYAINIRIVWSIQKRLKGAHTSISVSRLLLDLHRVRIMGLDSGGADKGKNVRHRGLIRTICAIVYYRHWTCGLNCDGEHYTMISLLLAMDSLRPSLCPLRE